MDIEDDEEYWAKRTAWAEEQYNKLHRPGVQCIMTFRGKTMSMSDWSRELGIKFSTLRNRKYEGWTDEEILGTPVFGAIGRRNRWQI